MGVKSNFLYSSILTSAGYFFTLLTYPYVSRVLGVTNIGIVNFVDNIINYFVLFSMMGIQTLGIREIANVRGDKSKISSSFFNILTLNFVFVVISCIALIVSIQVVPQFAEHKTLMYIGVTKLISSFMLIDWFYKGLENFKYVTIRTLIIRFFYVIAVFLFIKERKDYPIYFILAILIEVINALVNCIYVRKFVFFSLKNLQPFLYMRTALTLGFYALLTTMYKSFNIVFLGFVTNTTEVGYYTTATKLHQIILALFAAFTGVMLPRMSSLLSVNNIEEFKKKISQSYLLLIYFSFPLTVLGICFAPEIIRLISGPGYEKAAYPLVIVLPLVFIIGFEQILVYQILMPLKKDKAILINSIIGACVGISANIILVKHWGCIGSALVWLVSEIAVMISAMYYTKGFVPLAHVGKCILKNILYSIPIVIACFVLKFLDFQPFIIVILAILVIGIYYLVLYYIILKDEVVYMILPQKLRSIHKY